MMVNGRKAKNVILDILLLLGNLLLAILTILTTLISKTFVAHAFSTLAGFALKTATVFLSAVEMTFVLEMKNANTMNQLKLQEMITGLIVILKLVKLTKVFPAFKVVLNKLLLKQFVETAFLLETKSATMEISKTTMDATIIVLKKQDLNAKETSLLDADRSVETTSKEEMKNVMIRA